MASLAETQQALDLGADILDLKDPTKGALGAWPQALLAQAVRLVAGRVPVSATVGDLPMEPSLLLDAAHATAATGVDIVKLGFFSCAEPRTIVRALAPAARDGIRLVAVLMADQRPDLGLVPVLADAGFLGVMLDTADKRGGGLRQHLGTPELAGFVAAGRTHGLADRSRRLLDAGRCAAARCPAPKLSGLSRRLVRWAADGRPGCRGLFRGAPCGRRAPGQVSSVAANRHFSGLGLRRLCPHSIAPSGAERSRSLG